MQVAKARKAEGADYSDRAARPRPSVPLRSTKRYQNRKLKLFPKFSDALMMRMMRMPRQLTSLPFQAQPGPILWREEWNV
jgi:hypothetical protein